MPFIGHMVNHNDVVITEAQLEQLLGAMRAFWECHAAGYDPILRVAARGSIHPRWLKASSQAREASDPERRRPCGEELSTV